MVGGKMSRRAFKYFLKLSPEQIQRVAEECALLGPYWLVRVKRAGRFTAVTVRFESGRQKTVTV
jgi:hypothetical protein